VGLDRLTGLVIAAVVALAVVGCDSGKRPDQLLDGQPAAEFKPVSGSVVALGRVLRGTTLGRRFLLCRPDSVARDALVVERIGVFGESLTFADRNKRTVHACDGGVDPAGEHTPPWCSGSAGRLFEGRLLDPRLDIGCRDAKRRPLAYAWIEPVTGAHWIGVDQGGYTEIYEVLGGLPVRISTTRSIDLSHSRAVFEVSQYGLAGGELISVRVEAGVAG
jgi:hypothetical protein